MKRIYIIQGNTLQEYVPLNNQDHLEVKIPPKKTSNSNSENALLTLSDLTKKVSISKPTMYSWDEKESPKKPLLEVEFFFTLKILMHLPSKRKRTESLNQSLSEVMKQAMFLQAKTNTHFVCIGYKLNKKNL